MTPARRLLLMALVAVSGLCGRAAGEDAPPLPAVTPAPPVPEGLGVNIHFTDPRPGEMEMMARAGVRIVRMDFAWNGTEREKGVYDFSAYDRLLAALEPHGIKALFILDYSNRLYDGGLSPHTEEGRAAFARWAAAAVERFKGRGILWEMYNEPNIGFWKPKPNVADYVALALEVGKAIRRAAPQEQYIGPATSRIDFEFLEACFKAGLLEYWTAVSVHPYRQEAPETVIDEYARLRYLIDTHGPKGRHIPILSGEWGYSDAWGSMDEDAQGKDLPRQWLTNLACGVPVSIWYDWHDDGADPKEPEHHFGIVRHAYHEGRDPVYDAKPAYQAAATLTKMLAGFQFNKRLGLCPLFYHVLLFTRGEEVRLAVWTDRPERGECVLPIGPGRFAVTSHTGEPLPPLTADKQGLRLTLTDAPQYLAPDRPSDLLRLAAAWETAPLAVYGNVGGAAEVSLALKNPLERAIRVAVSGGSAVDLGPGQQTRLIHPCPLRRSLHPQHIRFTLNAGGLGVLCQRTSFTAANGLAMTVLPPAGRALAVHVDSPSGEPFTGTVQVAEARGLGVESAEVPLEIRRGEREKVVRFDLPQPAVARPRLAVRLKDQRGEWQASMPPTTYTVLDDFAKHTPQTLAAAWAVLADGDAKVASTQAVTVAPPPEPPPVDVGAPVLKITYEFGAGWKFLRVSPQPGALPPMEHEPWALGLWVYGDGTGNHLRMRFDDATGQTFQPGGVPMSWKGWRYVLLTMDASRAGHWGGANDGRLHPPVRVNTLLLIDSAERKATAGTIYVARPVLIDSYGYQWLAPAESQAIRAGP